MSGIPRDRDQRGYPELGKARCCQITVDGAKSLYYLGNMVADWQSAVASNHQRLFRTRRP